jgi:hypothetical protein
MRNAWLLVLSLAASGCEFVGDVFQAGFVAGIVIILLIVAAVAWAMRRFRGH